MTKKSPVLGQTAQPVVNDNLVPFIYFEEAPNFGAINGVFHISLATHRFTVTENDGVKGDLVAVASLRGNIGALHALKSAIDGAILLANPAAGGSKSN